MKSNNNHHLIASTDIMMRTAIKNNEKYLLTLQSSQKLNGKWKHTLHTASEVKKFSLIDMKLHLACWKLIQNTAIGLAWLFKLHFICLFFSSSTMMAFVALTLALAATEPERDDRQMSRMNNRKWHCKWWFDGGGGGRETDRNQFIELLMYPFSSRMFASSLSLPHHVMCVYTNKFKFLCAQHFPPFFCLFFFLAAATIHLNFPTVTLFMCIIREKKASFHHRSGRD